MSDEAPLVDVSNLDIADLVDAPEAVARSVQRLLDSLNDPDGIISAFNSFAS